VNWFPRSIANYIDFIERYYLNEYYDFFSNEYPEEENLEEFKTKINQVCKVIGA
jgi:hypothetical protein